MKRFAFKFIKWLGIFVVLLIIGLTTIAAFFEDQISTRLIAEINKQLKSELRVEKFNLSLLAHFPNASAELNNIKLDDNAGGKLLEAEKLAFQCGIFSLFSSDIQFKSMLIENGALFVYVDESGQANYDIFKTTSSSSNSDSDYALSLDEARLENVELIYIDERSRQEIKMQVKEAVTSGKFSGESVKVNSFAEMKSDFIEIDGKRYLPGKEFVYDAKIDANLTDGKYLFEQVDLAVEDNHFSIVGDIETIDNATDYDLVIEGKKGTLESMLALLPEEYLKQMGDLDTKGNFEFDGIIKGKQTKTKSPVIKANLALKDGKIGLGFMQNSLKNVSFNAVFSNGKVPSNASAVFEIADFKGYFNRELIQSKMRLSNLDDPRIDFRIDGVLPLAVAHGFLGMPSVSDGSGELEIKNFQLKGKLADMANPNRIGRVEMSGAIEFDDASLTINKEEIIVDRGKFIFRGNDLSVKDVRIEGAGNDIQLNGNFVNLVPVLFADSLNSQNAELKFRASLDAKDLDIDKLLLLSSVDESAETTEDEAQPTETTNQKRERLTNFLNGTFQAKIDNFNYNKIVGTNFSGSLKMERNEMIVKGKADAMDGTLNIDGDVFFEAKPYANIKIDCDEIDAKQFFEQCENFGQDILTHKNLRGDLKAKFAIDLFWDEKGELDMRKLAVLADVSAYNGELRDFEMLYDFSSYIKLKDLKRIKFVNLRNWFEVKRGKIYFPSMFIQSNALNLEMCGEHSFDNKMQYNFIVNAGQVVWNKLKRHNPKLEPIKAKKKGWFNIFYRVWGTVDKYQTKSDKRTVKRKMELSKKRKNDIQAKLLKVFGSEAMKEQNEKWQQNKYIPEYDDGDNYEEDFIPGFEDEKEESSEDKYQVELKNEADAEEEEEEYIEWEEEGLD